MRRLFLPTCLGLVFGFGAFFPSIPRCEENETHCSPAVTGRIYVSAAEYGQLQPFSYADTEVLLVESSRYPSAPKLFVWTHKDSRQVVAAVEVYVREQRQPPPADARFVSACGDREFRQGVLYIKSSLDEDALSGGGSFQARFYGKSGNDVILPFRPLLKGASYVGRVSAGNVPLDLTEHDLSRVGIIARDPEGNKVSEKTLPLKTPAFGYGEVVTTRMEVYQPFKVHHTGDLLIRAQFQPPLEFRGGGSEFYSMPTDLGGCYVETTARGQGTVVLGELTSAESGVYPIGLETEELVADPNAGADISRIGAWASGPVVFDAREIAVEGICVREMIEKGTAVDAMPVVPGGRGGEGGKPMLWVVPLALAAGEIVISKLTVGEKETYVTAIPMKIDCAPVAATSGLKKPTCVVAVPEKLSKLPIPMLGPPPGGRDIQRFPWPRIPPIKPSPCKYEMHEKPGEKLSVSGPSWLYVQLGGDGNSSAMNFKELVAMCVEKGLQIAAHPDYQIGEAILVDGKLWVGAGSVHVTKSPDGLVKIILKVKTPTIVKLCGGGSTRVRVEKLRYSSPADQNNWGFSNTREKIILHNAGAECHSGHKAGCTVDVRAKVAISGRVTMNALGGWLVPSSGNIQATVQGELWTIGLAPDTRDAKKIDVTQVDGKPPEYKLFAQVGYSADKGLSAQGGGQVTWAPCSSTNLGTGYGTVSINKQATCGAKGTLCYEGIVKVDLALNDMEAEVELFVVPNEFSVEIVRQCKHP